MRSLSRQRDRSRSEGRRTDEKRSGSKENKEEFKNCIACKCKCLYKNEKECKGIECAVV